MSHLPERKEKVCLNCGAALEGRFCHICGQENIEPKESFWHLVTHFVYDITHFDGKFFSTLKYLLFRPGFLSHEYLRGKRASYLHPIRMYVFTSAFFFLIFYNANKEREMVKVSEKIPTAAEVLKKLESKRKKVLEVSPDSLPAMAKTEALKKLAEIDADINTLKKDSSTKNELPSLKSNFNLVSFNDEQNNFRSEAEYDSAQKKKPAAERDNFIVRKFTRQNLHLREKYKNDNREIINAIIEKFQHLFPQMLFVSLPLFALILQLLYVRRKNFYYVNHVVFTIHLYCATFIIILAGMALVQLTELIGYGKWQVNFAFSLFGFYYWYKSLRKFYEQRRGKTILKYILAMFLSLFVMTILFALFFIFSAMVI